MPTERIYPPRNDSHSDQPMHVHVGWFRDSANVNVGVVHDDPDNKGRAAAFLDLDNRNSINRLIRVLRKARDQAYGADA